MANTAGGDGGRGREGWSQRLIPGWVGRLGQGAWLGQSIRLRARSVLALVSPSASPLDLQILGRTLLHTAVVGLAAGLAGAAFFAALEWVQRALLEGLAGYAPLRAFGEEVVRGHGQAAFHPWVLLALPALGALGAGLVTRLAPEARGGGGDAMIHAFHHQGGVIRRRVLWVKALASILTLGTGGSGGREGPTMQIGGALGSWVGSLLKVSTRERRVLMVSGVAAGISAVFRTPLGAALLAVESLYTDDFEAEALIPAILASVISYSVVISIFGETTLFARSPRYPFVPAHLPLYGLMALLLAAASILFLRLLRAVQARSQASGLPEWAQPALGGLALGVLAVPMVSFLGERLHAAGQGLGILGGGYGAAQVAITGSPLLPDGWRGVELLLLLGAAKALASSLTIGTGGSAGDFAPSMVLGALFGGAFGRAAALLTGDPRIDAGAFALVGMGTFYGGIAHVPLAALILVSELAGSYDLLVPLMLAEAIALVALRRHTLYEAQVRVQRESPVHRATASLDVLATVRVADILGAVRSFSSFPPEAPLADLLAAAAHTPGQDVFPVVDVRGRLIGLITADALRFLAGGAAGAMRARDVMQPPVAARSEHDLRQATELLVANGLRELPVVDGGGSVIGLLDESDVARAYLAQTRPPKPEPRA